MDYNPSDTTFYATLSNGTLVEQELDTETAETLFEGDSRVSVSTFSPDFRQFATVEDDTIVLTIGEEPLQVHFSGLSDRVRTLAFSPDSQMLISGSNDGTLLLWDVNPAILRTLAVPGGAASGLAISPDGRTILGGGGWFGSPDDTDLILWDADTGEILRRFEGNTTADPDVAISPDGNLAISTSIHDNTIAIWDVASGELLNRFEGLPNTHVIFSPDGQTAISSDPFARPVQWDVATSEVIRTFTESEPSLGNRLDGGGARHFINPIALSTDGKLLTSVIESTLLMWDVETGDEILRVDEVADSYGITFSPDDRLIATATTGQGIIVIEVDTGQIIHHFPEYDSNHPFAPWANGVAFSANSEHLLTGWRSGAVVLWNMETGSPTQLGYHNDIAWRVAYTPDGIPTSSGFDGTIIMWNIPNTDINWVEENRYIRDFTCEERETYRITPYCTDE